MMWHHAGIHEGRSGIAIFMTEIRTDELALVIADSVTVQLQLRFDLFIARHEDPARLPMALFAVLQHCLKMPARGMLLHRSEERRGGKECVRTGRYRGALVS